MRVFLALVMIAVLSGGCSQKTAEPPSAASNAAFQPAPVSHSRLDEQIKIYQAYIKENPTDVPALNKLAYMYTRKVRQTVDFSYNLSAEKLVQEALKLQPENYESLLDLSIIYMAQHRFTEARDTALRAVAANSYGSGALGILGDAYYELGSYAKCAAVYDKMGDLGPSAPYYARVASYRALIGDFKGARKLMQEALESSDYSDPEDHSWYYLQLGNLSFDSGQTQDAENYFLQALRYNSASYNAWAGLGKVQYAEGNPEEAISSYKKAIAIVPMPEFASALGDIYASLDRRAAAQKQYELVEYIGLLSKMNREIYNRQMALYYADHGKNLTEALRLVENEISFRKDVYGYDALAWCLYKNNKILESVMAIREALRMGTADSKIFYHAGIIYNAAHRRDEAEKFLKLAVEIQPRFHPLYSSKAAETIRILEASIRKNS